MSTSDEKDRYGDKLRQVGKVHEDKWAAERDRELLSRLRERAGERESEQASQAVHNVFKRILWPTDLAENSSGVLELARKLALQNSATLYVAHVCPTMASHLASIISHAHESEELARKQLHDVVAERLDGIEHEFLVTTGDAASKIIEIARSLQIDLIAMGTRGRRGIQRVLLGSVAEQVLREASCPVLTMRVG